MSLCDSCYHPGQCCRNLGLYGGYGPKNEATFWLHLPVDAQLDACRDETDVAAGRHLPFEVRGIAASWFDDKGWPYGVYQFVCPKLQSDGRCGIYDTRPWLCRVFEPASDRLCVHHKGAEGGDEIDIVALAQETA